MPRGKDLCWNTSDMHSERVSASIDITKETGEWETGEQRGSALTLLFQRDFWGGGRNTFRSRDSCKQMIIIMLNNIAMWKLLTFLMKKPSGFGLLYERVISYLKIGFPWLRPTNPLWRVTHFISCQSATGKTTYSGAFLPSPLLSFAKPKQNNQWLERLQGHGVRRRTITPSLGGTITRQRLPPKTCNSPTHRPVFHKEEKPKKNKKFWG